MTRRPRRGWLVLLLGFLTGLLGVYTLSVYALSYTVWVDHWLAGFLMLSLPVAMLLLLLTMLYWLLVRPVNAWFPLVVLLLGWPFWKRTLAWHPVHESLTAEHSLKVMSYNLMFFDVARYTDPDQPQTANAPKMIDWVVDFRADVKCFQEFYNWDEVNKLDVFRTSARLRKAGYRYALTLTPPTTKPESQGFIGLAIFSRYPLIRRVSAVYSSAGNGYLVADLVRGGDTIRIINVHLQSMGIRVGKVMRQRDLEGAENETRGIASQLKWGFRKRAGQIADLERLVEKSPYPVILCGDLNETPYGLVYGRLRRLLHNSFEDAGRGAGFTYNRSPRFIRIDNQFYSVKNKKLEGKSEGLKAVRRAVKSEEMKVKNGPPRGEGLKVTRFTTHSKIRFSDHNPISAEYVLK